MQIFFCSGSLLAQEQLGSLRYNPVLHNHKNIHRLERRTSGGSLSLPFFDDFTGYSPLPDPNLWADSEAYINNTMGVGMISRGVASLDGLNKFGLPYDTVNNTDFVYADSLTSLPINLSYTAVTPGDSVYLSFFYEAGGNGFYPYELGDSLMLFLRNRFGVFVKVWSVPGINPDSAAPAPVFTQVMIPITDSLFFTDSFQFRFVNIAAMEWADAVWNLDYIRLGSNRSDSDTIINDVAMTTNPTFLLNDYTSMPYSHFMANISGEIAHFVTDSLRNDSSFAQNPNYTFAVYDTTGSGAPITLLAPVSNFVNIAGYQTIQLPDSLAITYSSFASYPASTVVSMETISYIVSTPYTGPRTNDTIAKRQVFDNYLAYDDGSAEKAWYLMMDISGAIPGELEIEFHLNHPDTLRGLAIYFARQVPLPEYKVFSIMIYNSLIGVNGYYTDNLLREQDYCVPEYIDTINHFWIYKLDTPLVLPSGTFYAGTMQPAYSNSDSLYFGFDVNRIGGNHAYFRTSGGGEPWTPSLFNGAIMLRPLLGHDITSSSVPEITAVPPRSSFAINPNPAHDRVNLNYLTQDYVQAVTYTIYNEAGAALLTGSAVSGRDIDISNLIQGVYFVAITDLRGNKEYRKFIKI